MKRRLICNSALIGMALALLLAGAAAPAAEPAPGAVELAPLPAQPAVKKPMTEAAGRIEMPAQVPEGAVIRGDHVQILDGYVAEPISENQAVMRKGSTVTGTFSCECTSRGACSISVEGGSMSCVSHGCSFGCTMKIDIDPRLKLMQ